MKKHLILLLLVFGVISLHALDCVIMDQFSDPDEDGFYFSRTAANVTVINAVVNSDYCPATYTIPANGITVRLIDISNREACQEINTFKTSHVRTYDWANATGTWLTTSHPGNAENNSVPNSYDDDCDGMVNEFSFEYYHEIMGNRQLGEGSFRVIMNINEPLLLFTNLYDIVFDVYEIGQLDSLDPTLTPGTPPILSERVAYTGGTTLTTTIAGLENKDQVYAVKARAMTRETNSRQIQGFDVNGDIVLDPALLFGANDTLYSHYYFIFLSRYANGASASPVRNTIVNDAFWYKHLADTGTISRQNNYDTATDTGFNVDYTNGDYFAKPTVQWCSEYVASTYYFAGTGILISTEGNHQYTYLELNVNNMADWFGKTETSQNNLARRDNLLVYPQVNANDGTANVFVSTPLVNRSDFFDITRLKPGDYISTNNFNHSVIFLGVADGPSGDFYTIEGNSRDDNTTLLNTDGLGDTVGMQRHEKSEIRFLGALPY